MSIPVEDLTAFLLANAGIAAIVGTHVYSQNLPEKPPAAIAGATGGNLPALVYSQISGVRPSTMEGATGLSDARYQFACLAYTYLTTKNLSQAVRVALLKLKATIGSTAILDTSLLVERDFYNNVDLVFRCDLDFQIWHREP
jgi:hypothetical protein